MAYYMNPQMLAHQYAVWANYAAELRDNMEIVIVDDGSPRGAAIEVARPQHLPVLRLYRVTRDRPWNQHGARNLGAKEARGEWLLLTDMDHVVPADSMTSLTARLDQPNAIYTFLRLDAPHLTPALRPDGSLKPHGNTFAMTRDLYWRIGGYDERYCGLYGTDGMFRKRAAKYAAIVHLDDVPVVRYSRSIIPDASTTTLVRKPGHGSQVVSDLERRLRALGTTDQIETITFPWERVL
jgi:hypothetical protein